MADNPFNIDSLNSVNFSDDELRAIGSFNTDPDSGGVNGSSAVKVGNLVDGWVGEPSVPSAIGTITVLSSSYMAGHTEYSADYYGNERAWYYLPTFGSIQVSDYLNESGDPYTLYIHGFSENGLLLSQNENLVYNDRGGLAAGSPVTSGAENARAFVLGFEGVSDDIVNTTFDKDPGVVSIPEAPVVCFAEGTSITTPVGEDAIEVLSAGDMVLTASGIARRIKWIGQLVVHPRNHPRPHEVNPVRICAGAFGAAIPTRDLCLSPGHSVYVDGVLVPVGKLINGATIVQEAVEQIRYFHIELDSHDVLLAEGLPCESYLDDDNRSSFLNSDGHVALYGRLDPKNWDDACAPLVADGPQLTAIRSMLQAEAEGLGWLRTERAELKIEVDGAEISPQRQEGNRFWFAVPATEAVVLRSNSSILSHILPDVADQRILGVAVADLRVNGESVNLDASAFREGFYPVEWHGSIAWRWTDGAAKFELDGQSAIIEIVLTMVAPTWCRMTDTPRIAA